MKEKTGFGKNMQTLETVVREQIEIAFKEGTRVGELNTAVTIYIVLRNCGLEKDNIIFDILRDVAKNAGCDDLEAKAQEFKNYKPKDKTLN